MEWLDSFAAWAWARHHNVLSWYIRPLFLLPFCYFAYRRSPFGVLTTLLALLTSMFWFPEPRTVDPGVASALAAERDYLLGPWPLWKVGVVLLIPASLIALAAAFWRRSWIWGACVVNLIAAAKIIWTAVVFQSEAFIAHLMPAVTGLLVCNAVIWLLYRRFGQAAT